MHVIKVSLIASSSSLFSAHYFLSLSVKCMISLYVFVVCVYWLKHSEFTGWEAERRSFKTLMLITLSVLARCVFLKLFLPCFVFYGWGMGQGIVGPRAFIRVVPGVC